MTSSLIKTMMVGVGIAAAASSVEAQILVENDISVSTTWTNDNTYQMTDQIYVLPGATLTIEAGTVIQSVLGGSLAVSRGGQIFAQGTETDPVIMTSNADVATWAADASHPTGKNPKTGTWREAANEWGNLTIMGDGYISEDQTVGNVATPDPANFGEMEGLVPQFVGDPRVRYGGGNDNDDSGSISYLSIRYGGTVVAIQVELNGLSLGGIGRETDIHHVEIMNNVDDGIEIWGGCVNLKNISIWNVGDDSFDVDQGWRGKAQFGLIVQGFSINAAQGSGVGDNALEVDGAEDSDWQPVTTASIYNFTVIGQPEGDGATAWRDNARVQYRNCIFMDIGEKVIRFDGDDGDGASGYGHNGTQSWASLWTEPYTTTSSVNPPANPGVTNPAAFYKAQSSGSLCEMRDSVFFNNINANAYTEAENIGTDDGAPSGFNIFTAPGNFNVKEPANSPITAITRAAPVIRGGLVQQQVTFLDPRPANDALNSAGFAPFDGFFSSARYRGAFAPGNNWLCDWTASAAFGFTPTGPYCDLGESFSGTVGDPVLTVSGSLAPGSLTSFSLSKARPFTSTLFTFSLARTAPGSLILPDLSPGISGFFIRQVGGAGTASVDLPWPILPSGLQFYVQFWTLDVGGPWLFSGSNAVSVIQP